MDNWYIFCTHQCGYYRDLGMNTAAMVYWCMRFWGRPEDARHLTEDKAVDELGDYWQFKMDTTPHMFD